LSYRRNSPYSRLKRPLAKSVLNLTTGSQIFQEN